MTQAFHQIEIAPADRIKTSFAVGHRFYCFKRAIMGFTNSPADLEKLLDKVFGDMTPHVYHYVDDFVLLSSSFEEHMNLLREVAKRLRKANLTVSKDVVLFYTRHIFGLCSVKERPSGKQRTGKANSRLPKAKNNKRTKTLDWSSWLVPMVFVTCSRNV